MVCGRQRHRRLRDAHGQWRRERPKCVSGHDPQPLLRPGASQSQRRRRRELRVERRRGAAAAPWRDRLGDGQPDNARNGEPFAALIGSTTTSIAASNSGGPGDGGKWNDVANGANGHCACSTPPALRRALPLPRPTPAAPLPASPAPTAASPTPPNGLRTARPVGHKNSCNSSTVTVYACFLHFLDRSVPHALFMPWACLLRLTPICVFVNAIMTILSYFN